jgi:hypothetical protein
MLQNDPLRHLSFHFDADLDPDPALHFDADPGPAYHKVIRIRNIGPF